MKRPSVRPREGPISKRGRASAGLAFDFIRKFPAPMTTSKNGKITQVYRRNIDTGKYAPWNRKMPMRRGLKINPYPLSESKL